MENTHRLFGLFAILLVLVAVTYFGCNNGDDDDSNDDDVIDDDLDDDTSGKLYQYYQEPDPTCGYHEKYFVIYSPATCESADNGGELTGASYPFLGIGIEFNDDYVLEQKHGPKQNREVDGSNCVEGFDAAIFLSDEPGDRVFYNDGFVNVERIENNKFRVEFDITFEDGSVQQGVWQVAPCGEPVPN